MKPPLPIDEREIVVAGERHVVRVFGAKPIVREDPPIRARDDSRNSWQRYIRREREQFCRIR